MSAFRFGVVGAALMGGLCVVSSAPSYAQASSAKGFEIESQSIAKALFAFARQSGVSIATPRGLSYRDGKANSVKGSYSIEAALTQLLKGTGFGFEKIGGTSFKVLPKRIEPVVAAVEVSEELVGLPDIEEILVTSLLRPDLAHKVPYSITSFRLTESFGVGLNQTANVARKVSSFNAVQQGNGQTKLIIRGLSDGALAGRTQALVGTYLNGSQVSQNGPEPNLRLVDVDRLEVLRGPQGTLYGSGALSGLYRIVTNQPDASAFGLNASATLASTRSGAASQMFTSTVNLPLAEDKLALRATGFYEKNGGFVDDLGGANATQALSNVNESEVWGGRVLLALDGGDNWTVTLGAAAQNIEADDSSYFLPTLGGVTRNNNFSEPNTDKFRQVSAALELDMDWAELSADFSYINRRSAETIDASSVELEIFEEAVADAQLELLQIDRDQETFSLELHLKSKAGQRLEWITGAFFAERNEDLSYGLGAANNLAVYDEKLDESQREYALFAEATYFLTEKFSITAGGRFFDYDTSARDTASGLLLDGPSTLEGQQQQNGFTPKAVVSYHPSDEGLVYAQFSQGYRLGGINIEGLSALEPSSPNAADEILENFVSDRLDSFELGYKYQRPDRRFALNAAAFFANWSNIQAREFDDLGLPVVANVGDAEIYGAELDISFRPRRNIELKGNFTYNNSKIADTNNALGASRGDRLPAAPKIAFGLSGNLDTQISSSILANISLDYSYIGGYRLFFAQRANTSVDAFHLMNFQTSFYWQQVRLTLFVNNVLDSNDNLFAFGNPFLSPVSGDEAIDSFSVIPRPRTIGVDFGYQF